MREQCPMILTNERYLKLIHWKMFMFSSEINAPLSAGMLYVIDTVVTIRVKNILVLEIC